MPLQETVEDVRYADTEKEQKEKSSCEDRAKTESSLKSMNAKT